MSLDRLAPELVEHGGDGAAARPALLWRLGPKVRVASTAVVGGGLGTRAFVVNAEVDHSYDRTDIAAHAEEIAGQLRCNGDGVVMLTAFPVVRWVSASEDGVEVVATVGLSTPTWAADRDGARTAWRPGTVNIVAWVPVALSDGALVNGVATIAEAKVQALLDAAVPGTGTASDAICLGCPDEGGVEPFAGPRSRLGARLARATHVAVSAGIERWRAAGGSWSADG